MQPLITWILARPKRVLGIIALVTLGLCATFGNLRLAQLRTEEQLSKEDPVSLAYQKFTEEFGNDLDLLVIFQTEDGLFNAKNIDVVRNLTQDFEGLDKVARVLSLANAEYQWVDEDSFHSRMFLDTEAIPSDAAGFAQLQEAALAYEPFANRFLSADAKVAVFVVRPKPGMMTALEAHEQITQLLAEKYASLDVRMLGEAVGFAAFQKLLGKEATILTLVSLAFMGLLLFLCFRSLWGVLLPGAVTVLSIVLTIATYAVLGHTFSGMSMMVTAILLAVALADSIHYYGHFREKYLAYGDRVKANLETVKDVFKPCLFTSLTTALGFGSLVIATNLDLVYLAIHAAIGTMIAYVLTFTLMPAALVLLPPPSAPRTGQSRLIDRALEGIVQLNLRWGAPLAFGIVALSSILIAGLPRLAFDQDNLSMLPRDHSIIRDAAFLADRVGIGGTNLQLQVAGAENAIDNPAAMRAIDRLQAHLRTQPKVRKVTGLVDEMKISYRIIHGDLPEYHIVPTDEEDFRRLFYMLSDSADIRSILSADNAKTVINVAMDQTLMSEYDKVLNAAKDFVANDPEWPRDLTLSPQGMHALISAQYHALAKDQIEGFTLAFLLITVAMCFLFRSLKLGLLSMIPNLLPIFATLGFMGWAGIYVSGAMIVVINIALGLAVDDTIHFLYAYGKLKRHGEPFDHSLGRTLRAVGIPMIFTSVILMASFGSFTVSSMPMMFQIGTLLTLPIFTALAADLFVTPYLLRLIEPKPAAQTQSMNLEEVALEA